MTKQPNKKKSQRKGTRNSEMQRLTHVLTDSLWNPKLDAICVYKGSVRKKCPNLALWTKDLQRCVWVCFVLASIWAWVTLVGLPWRKTNFSVLSFFFSFFLIFKTIFKFKFIVLIVFFSSSMFPDPLLTPTHLTLSSFSNKQQQQQ